MSKTKPPRKGDKDSDIPTAAPKKSGDSTGKAVRETIESVVIAFVLAFLFRTFEAEAFVIPTGSMAPTLQGRHLDLTCPKCGRQYRAGASLNDGDQAQANDPNLAERERDQANSKLAAEEVVGATCPMCRYVMDVAPDTPAGEANPPYSGDRILVGKFVYDFANPQRWDVFVFKYPGDAKVNYIKRLVGLPNESLKIYHGDIYTKPLDAAGADFQIVRKPDDKLLAMLQTVYDTDYVVKEMNDAGWPLRWQAWPPAAATAPAWTTADGGRSYAVEAHGDQPAWLRYRHTVPTEAEWQAILNGRLQADQPPRPQLITDFYAYDAVMKRYYRGHPPNHTLGMNWVGDLKLDAQLQVDGNQGQVIFELVKAGRHFRATLDVASGEAALSIDGLNDFQPQAKTAVHGPGSHQVSFANIDRQLSLWVDGQRIAFDHDTTYGSLGDDIPTADDLAPAGIAAAGTRVSVEHVKLWRDIYYIADQFGAGPARVIVDYPLVDGVPPSLDSPDQLGQFLDFFSNPERWKARDGHPSPFDERREVKFDILADKFIALGDNSPFSADSRLWPEGPFVDRSLLIGKALFIYWPHYWPWKHHITVRLGSIEFEFPFWPNFRRMGFVR